MSGSLNMTNNLDGGISHGQYMSSNPDGSNMIDEDAEEAANYGHEILSGNGMTNSLMAVRPMNAAESPFGTQR